jgi:hypothetical protein
LPLVACAAAAALLGASSALLSVCGPFTDVAADSFCPFVLEIFTLGITTGTTPTTYDPSTSVTRLQMAAFLSRTVDGALKRGSRRAAHDQYWTSQNAGSLGLTTVGVLPQFVRSDRADLWIANYGDATVSRVRGSDGKLLETWTGAGTTTIGASGIAIVMGRVFVTSAAGVPGRLFRIDPSQPPGAVTTVASNLGNAPITIAFDGARIWTANFGAPGSVSIVTPGATIPWATTTVTTGFSGLQGALWDGGNIWVTDYLAGALRKLDGNGAILQTVTVGSLPEIPIFDGTNIWVPNNGSNSVSVVRASTGAVLTTLTGNGLAAPITAAFDGQRLLVTNTADSVSLWKATDFAVLGTFGTGSNSQPLAACSDGLNFWITLSGTNKLARF